MMKQAAPGAKLLLVGTQKDWDPVRPARAHAGYKTHSNKNNSHVKFASLAVVREGRAAKALTLARRQVAWDVPGSAARARIDAVCQTLGVKWIGPPSKARPPRCRHSPRRC